ncbi:MAG: HgcAB-associated protein HgcC [Candidatus Bathyarchaeia archaeon]
MNKEKDEEVSCGVAFTSGCCKLEALVRVDERGQIVLPKDLRERAGIKAGDKLVIVASEKEEKVCCLMLMRAEDLRESIRKTFGPLFEELVK